MWQSLPSGPLDLEASLGVLVLDNMEVVIFISVKVMHRK